jgi:hypothetical protein
MTTDRYTKAVLTIIAISLSVIAIQIGPKDAHAQSNRFIFAQSGALIVAVCDSNGVSSRYNCAEVEKLERK